METWLLSDFWKWLKAIMTHWIARIGGPLVAAFQIFYGIWRRDWPPALGWAILAGCFVWATFLAWRDEHRKTIGRERRLILNKVIDLISESGTDVLGALIRVSDEFGSDEEVAWVCQQLDEHGHYDPFGVIPVTAVFEPGFDGKRLKFLEDARVAGINRLEEAIDYLHSGWASKNGLIDRRTKSTQ